jgi:hypothetical protein
MNLETFPLVPLVIIAAFGWRGIVYRPSRIQTETLRPLNTPYTEAARTADEQVRVFRGKLLFAGFPDVHRTNPYHSHLSIDSNTQRLQLR